MFVDSRSGAATVSNTNGVLEPGESVAVEPSWGNETGIAYSYMEGSLSSFTGPTGGIYSLQDASGFYAWEPIFGDPGTCLDCYAVSAGGTRPVTHWDATVVETVSAGGLQTWTLHIGESFADVPTDNPFYNSIETLFHNGVTAGCFGGGYCPGSPVTRAQVAVLLLKSKFGAAHVPPPCTGSVFTDVHCTGSPYDPWIEELVGVGITAGCGGNLYCPGNSVTRAQVAVLLLKTREGSAYVPPACTGVFIDVACTPGTGFSDWIEELHGRGITGGCSVAPALYCPTDPTNRGQVAAFLTRTFGFVLYGS